MRRHVLAVHLVTGTWTAIPRYRGKLVCCACPFCGFLIASVIPETDHYEDHSFGRLLLCPRCDTIYREGLHWIS